MLNHYTYTCNIHFQPEKCCIENMEGHLELPPIELVPTRRGGEHLLCQDFKFRLNRRANDGKRSWKCAKETCPANATTDEYNR